MAKIKFKIDDLYTAIEAPTEEIPTKTTNGCETRNIVDIYYGEFVISTKKRYVICITAAGSRKQCL